MHVRESHIQKKVSRDSQKQRGNDGLKLFSISKPQTINENLNRLCLDCLQHFHVNIKTSER